MNILGISAYYLDSAAALLRDGEIVAAQEERFSRKKHNARFPLHTMEYCLAEAGIPLGELGHIVFHDKPLVKFERWLEPYLAYAPRGRMVIMCRVAANQAAS